MRPLCEYWGRYLSDTSMEFSSIAQSVVHPMSPAAESRTVRTLGALVRWGLTALAALIPLMFLPWTFEVFEFNKQALLLVGGFIVLLLWVSQAVVARRATLVRSPLSWAALAVLAVTIASAFFSVDPVTSVIGFYGRFNGGVFSTVGYLVFFFLVLQNARNMSDARRLMGAWLVGCGLGALVLLLQLVGLRWLPSPIGDLASFTPLGASLNAVALMLAASLPVAVYFVRQGRAWVRYLAMAFSVVALVTMAAVDYNLGWIGLAVGSAAWLVLVFYKNESVGLSWTVIPSVAILLSAAAWPIVTTTFTKLPVPVEVNLSLRASWKVAFQNVQANPAIGTGPETFLYGFSKYKPDNFNDSNFWAFRFDRATSELAQIMSTLGFIGLAVYVTFLGLGLYLAWRAIRERSGEDWYFRAALAAGYLVLVLAHVLYFAGTSLAVMTMLVVGILAAQASSKVRSLSLSDSPRASLGFSFGLAVVVLLAVGVTVIQVRFWLADVAYAKAQAAAQSVDTLGDSQAGLLRAIELNPWRDTYRIGLAQVLMAQANRVALEPAGATEEERQAQFQRLQSFVASSIAAARSATELAGESVSNWEVLGSVYRGTALFARDAEPWVISSFERAVQLEPTNPALITELGKAYLFSASRKRQEAQSAKEDDKGKLEAEANSQVQKAIEQFDRAIALRDSYLPAHFQVVLALEQQGKFSEAIDKLERMREAYPQDADILYELGSLYFGTNDLTKAEEAFGTITSLIPNHSNAHFGLALVHRQQGDIDKAIQELEKVLELNPGNADIEKAISDLKSGQPADAATTPPAQPAPPAPSQP